MSGCHDATDLQDLQADNAYLFRHRPAISAIALYDSVEQDGTDFEADFRRD
jgi:hypothetical protein